MRPEVFIDKMCNLLLTLPLAGYAQGGRWITCRCRYCNDSLNAYHKHFGIHIPQNDKELFYFNCFKCHTSKRLEPADLIAWGFNDIDMLGELSRWNSRVLALPENRMFKNQIFKVKNTNVTGGKVTEAKLKYINTRLGINMTLPEAIENKIVFNLRDLLDQNHIHALSRNPNIVDNLNRGFVGFLTQDRAFVNMRRLVKEEYLPECLHKRYVNYNIFNKYDNTQRYYTIPSTIDDLCPKIRLIIAEGPFDILSIYYNIFNKDKDNIIYTSITGSGYLQILEFFIIKSKLINLEVHIFKDKDISLQLMKDIKELLKIFNIPLIVHENGYQGQKDYGVSKDKIIDNIVYIN